MSSRAPDLLSSIFSTERLPSVPLFHGGTIALKVRRPDAEPLEVPAPPASKRRTAIWEMHPSVHCSIIGTCLSAGELQRLLIKLGVDGAAAADDHTLHKQAVVLAGRQQGGGKFIQKALDRRHEAAIKQRAKLADENSLLRSWEDALKRGEIPGAYWAVLSHPAATENIMRRAFGDVHMLSHMVGAANRADIRRLRELEDLNAALAAKLELQQRHLRDGFVARDEKIRLLNEALSRALAQAPVSAAHVADDAVAARDALIDLERRLNREVARRERLAARLETMTLACREAESRRQAAEHENSKLRNEIALVEAHFNTSMAQDANPQEINPEGIAATMPELDGTLVLYVGGRARQVPALKAVVERAGGIFLHHDGGIEHAAALLPGLVSRADCAAFPIDCVSHDAMTTVKRLCRQAGKPLIPLRTSSLASLLSGLSTLKGASCAGAAAH
jgi:uncharacterized protein DUF2325